MKGGLSLGIIDFLKGTKAKLLSQRALVVSALETYRKQYEKDKVHLEAVTKDLQDPKKVIETPDGYLAFKRAATSNAKVEGCERQLETIDKNLAAM